MNAAQRLQERYYSVTAREYDAMHVCGDHEHAEALDYVSAFSRAIGVGTILDVGSGTGRAEAYFADQPIQVVGVEPVHAMLEEAVRKTGVSSSQLVRGSGHSLPFPSGSFDAVCEFGVLHHVPNPNSLVQEMMRVARKAIFLSDDNRFGQGRLSMRLLKLALSKAHLWRMANFVKTKGKMYIYTEGDGVSYAYSVYDSYDQLAQWADRVILMPTRQSSASSWWHPLLTSSHVLLCAVRDA